MVRIIKPFCEYKPWSGAVDTFNAIKYAGKLEALESYVEDCFGRDTVDETDLNDLLWHEGSQVLKDLGIEDKEDEEDEDVV